MHSRGVYRNITSYSQLAGVFAAPPHGGTNTVNVLQLIARDHMGADQLTKPLVIHIFTDGMIMFTYKTMLPA